MALITKAIKGTKDVLPKDVHKNQYIEATALDIASKFGYKEIRTPVFEHTELFQRGVGDTTDARADLIETLCVFLTAKALFATKLHRAHR